MRLKRFKRLMAFALATVLTVSSFSPAAVQTVEAAEVVSENPFGGKNVALGKDVIVTSSILENPTADASILVNGDIGDSWEPTKWDNQSVSESSEYPLDIVIDLEDEYLIDHVTLYWNSTCYASEYNVYVAPENGNYTQVANVTATPTNEVNDYTFDPSNARYIKVECKVSALWHTYTLREIEAYTIGGIEVDSADSVNHALNVDGADYPIAYAIKEHTNAANCIDGDVGTRWTTGDLPTESDEEGALRQGDPIWYCIDLGEEKSFDEVKILWEGAFATAFTVDIAKEGVEVRGNELNGDIWENVAKGGVSAAEWSTHKLGKKVTARYVRILGTSFQSPQYGMSIFEIQINESGTVDVDKIYLSQTEDILFSSSGEKVQLYAQALPANGVGAGDIKWSSSKEEVATVDADGIVTAVAKGQTVITASVGNVTATVNVLFAGEQLATPGNLKAEKSENNITLSWNDVDNATKYEVYRSVNGEADEKIAEVIEETMYVDTDVEAGNSYVYKVRAKAADDVTNAPSDHAISETITMELGVDSVSLDQSDITLEIKTGEAVPSVTLVATILPEKATNKNVSWITGDSTIAKVDANGKVTAVGAGTTTITVETEDDKETATCEVTVKEQLGAPVVTAVKDGESSVTLSWNEVANAASYTIYRATGKAAIKAGPYSEIAKDVKTTTYTDEIGTDVIGNIYSYKVVANASADEGTLYTESNISETTATIQIGEVSPFGVNVAEGVTVTSDNQHEADFVVDYLLDGIKDDEFKRWSVVAGSDGTVSCVIDLGKVYLIDTVNIVEWDYSVADDFDIQLSTDGNEFGEAVDYAKIENKDGSFRTSRLTLGTMTEAQYVKVTFKGEKKAVYVPTEVEVFTPGSVVMGAESVDTVDSVLISKDKLTLVKGQKADLFAQPLPANTTTTVVWTSSDEDLATVVNGKVTAVAGGVATITATAGGKTAECEVTVMEQLATPENLIAALSEDMTQIELRWNAVEKADSYTLYRKAGDADYAELTTVDSSDEIVNYSDEDVEEGVTYSYKVVATSKSDYLTDSKESNETEPVTVPIRVETITVAETLTVEAEETATLVAAITPENATFNTVTWESADEGIVKVDENGMVTGVKAGTTTITAKADEKSATCTVIVTEKLETPAVVAEMSEDEQSITLTWNEIENAEKYEVSRKSDTDDDYKVVYTVEGLTYVDSDLTKGATYSYIVKAINETNKDIYPESMESEATKGIIIPIHVDAVSIEDEATIYVDGTTTLDVTITPDNASNQEVTWESGDDNIATVDNGTVKGIAIGSTTITVTAVDGGVTAECTVTVLEKLETPEVTAVKADDNKSITVSWEAVDNAASYVIYRTEDGTTTEIAVANDATSYKDSELKEGKTYSYQVEAIAAESTENAPSYYVTSDKSAASTDIYIPISVTDVTLDNTKAELEVGGEITLKSRITPANATNTNVKWTTSDDQIATVKNGVVKALAEGKVTITVTTDDGDKTAECTVIVLKKLDAPEVTAVKADDNKSITVSWKAIDNAASYVIYKTEDGTTTEIAVAKDTTSYKDSDVKEGKKYSYQVAAIAAESTEEALSYYVTSSKSDATADISIPVSVTGVSLDKTTAELVVGGELTLKATVAPDDATNKNVSWTSSDEKVATVKDGVVKAVAEGKATITVTTADGAQKAICEVTVKASVHTHSWSEVRVIEDATTKTTGIKGQVCTDCGEINPDTKEVMPKYTIKLNAKSAVLQKGKSTTAFKATVVKGDKIVKWSSSNKNVATVNSKGKITASKKKTGTAKITVTSEKGAKATITIKVQNSKVKTTKISVTNVSKNKITLKKGAKFTIKTSITPITSPEKVKYTTSNKQVVTVTSKGVLTAKKKGTAKITIKSGSKKTTINVYVK